jgi:hypothetical protein
MSTRRTAERHQVRLRLRPVVRFVVKPSLDPQGATIHDLSTAGIGFVVRHPLEPGAAVAIELRAASARHSWVRVAEVRHATPYGTGPWLVGCVFSQPIRLDDVMEPVGVE